MKFKIIITNILLTLVVFLPIGVFAGGGDDNIKERENRIKEPEKIVVEDVKVADEESSCCFPKSYPFYVYDSVENNCLKIYSELDEEIYGDLGTTYHNVKNCYAAHPKLLLRARGWGFLMWVFLFVLMIVYNFIFLKKIKKLTIYEVKSNFSFDIIFIATLISLLCLYLFFLDPFNQNMQFKSVTDAIVYRQFILYNTSFRVRPSCLPSDLSFI